MTWNLFGQYLDVVFACTLMVRLSRLDLHTNYIPFLIFIAFDCIQSIAYLLTSLLWRQGFRFLDYRLVWSSMRFLAWITTIWMVYALLTRILKQLPGIARFSVRFLNITFSLAVLVSLFTIRPEYRVSTSNLDPGWKARVTAFALVLDRTFAFAELLSIISILAFLVFFPIRVPRNLAIFSAGLSIYLFTEIGWRLTETYLPHFSVAVNADPIPFVMAACLVYWIFALSRLGEHARATLGRAWQSLPSAELVRQLEAINASLLGARKPTSELP